MNRTCICSFGYVYFPIIYLSCKWWLHCQQRRVLNSLSPIFPKEYYYQGKFYKADGYETDMSDNENDSDITE